MPVVHRTDRRRSSAVGGPGGRASRAHSADNLRRSFVLSEMRTPRERSAVHSHHGVVTIDHDSDDAPSSYFRPRAQSVDSRFNQVGYFNRSCSSFDEAGFRPPREQSLVRPVLSGGLVSRSSSRFEDVPQRRPRVESLFPRSYANSCALSQTASPPATCEGTEEGAAAGHFAVEVREQSRAAHYEIPL